MVQNETAARLSRITTMWTLLEQAHTSCAAQPVNAAQAILLDRYRGAVFRYLLGATRDRDAAEELFQEFALRFLRGDFRSADASRGRFRDYLKTSLIHLITDSHRRSSHQMARLSHEPDDQSHPASDQSFDAGWKTELMNRAWEALRREHPRLHALLLVSTESGNMTSAQLAAAMSQRWGQLMKSGAARTSLCRARRKFADALVEEVRQSLASSDADELALELRHLGLLKLCQGALGRELVEVQCQGRRLPMRPNSD